MADGEQDWIAKYRAALDATPMKKTRTLRGFLVEVAKKLSERAAWIFATRHLVARVAGATMVSRQDPAASPVKNPHSSDSIRMPATLEAAPVLVKRAS